MRNETIEITQTCFSRAPVNKHHRIRFSPIIPVSLHDILAKLEL